MKFSEIKVKTLRNVNEASKNAELLLKAGYINQLASGIYTFLPLGKRVLDKVNNIIREEMNAIGGVEILMPALHPKENWEKTGRYNLDVMYKVGKEYGLGWTHEEVVTPLVKQNINSYKDLPLYYYQIQTKFRNEPRAKSGLLRTREFPMKDLYSFHRNEDELSEYYEIVKKAYFNIYKRCGLGEVTLLTYASGGDFSKYSHEYQTLCDAGEDTIYTCEKCKIAVNKEIVEEKAQCPECQGVDLVEAKAIEVGNIFKLGTRFSQAFDLKYTDKDGKENLVWMGCYGIGPSRLMGTIVEHSFDDRGIMWPKNVAPFDVHLVELDGKSKESETVYEDLQAAGLDVLWDDREETAGVKLGDADLIGIPTRIVISERTLKEGKIEVKQRNEKESQLMKLDDFTEKMSSHVK